MDFENIYMSLAVKEAFKYQFITYPNPAVGSVVLYKGAIVAIEAHQKAGTSHAEVLALLSAYRQISGKSIDFDRFNAILAHNFLLSLPKDFFKECSIYVTLEPCSHVGKTPSCANLITTLGLKEVIIGAKDPIKSHSGGIDILEECGIRVKFLDSYEAKVLLEPFIIWQDRAFVLFKLAQTINGQIGGGYISSKNSLKHTHKIREVCSSLLIGGNTVRVDRPTLDCRFINAKAPNVIIYSKSGKLESSIPLFSVEGREVKISSKLDFLDKPSLILVEGGDGMFKAIKDKIDWFLNYQAPKIAKKSVSYYSDIELEFINASIVGDDLRIYSRFKTTII